MAKKNMLQFTANALFGTWFTTKQFLFSSFFFALIFVDSNSNVPMDLVAMWFSPRDIKSCVRLVNRFEFVFQLEIACMWFFRFQYWVYVARETTCQRYLLRERKEKNIFEQFVWNSIDILVFTSYLYQHRFLFHSARWVCFVYSFVNCVDVRV